MKVKGIRFLAKGHRSKVYTGKYGNKMVVVKRRLKGISVKGHILNEGSMLRLLNKHGIGPKIYYYDKDKAIMEHVKGDRILDWVAKTDDKPKVRWMARQLLEQCRKMDKLGIEKKEMHMPVKHVIIGKKVVMIDFERARKSSRPGNVTQACHFLIRNGLMKKDLGKLRDYKKHMDDKRFNALLKLVF